MILTFKSAIKKGEYRGFNVKLDQEKGDDINLFFILICELELEKQRLLSLYHKQSWFSGVEFKDENRN